MDNQIRTAIERVKSVIARRPEFARDEESAAVARWEGGLRVITADGNGVEITSDMPPEIGGSGGHVTPGWLMRAGLASCAVTRIVMTAAEQGVELSTLEVSTRSHADVRGLLGVPDASGQMVLAGSREFTLQVRIGARDCSDEALRALVEHSDQLSPISTLLREKIPLRLQVDIVSA